MAGLFFVQSMAAKRGGKGSVGATPVDRVGCVVIERRRSPRAPAPCGRQARRSCRRLLNLCLQQENLPAHRRGDVRMRLWQVEKELSLHWRYFSQAGQDRYLNERIFGNKRDGTFVEFGGYDGWTGSNCVFSRGRWDGPASSSRRRSSCGGSARRGAPRSSTLPSRTGTEPDGRL